MKQSNSGRRTTTVGRSLGKTHKTASASTTGEIAMSNQIKRHKTTGAESSGTWVEPVATIREVEENEEEGGNTEP